MKNKTGIEIHHGQYWLNQKPFFIYSGEFHYFRVPAKVWATRLRRAKQMGLNTVGSYIPWIWHEPEEGQLDFSGKTHPQRNLIGFLDQVQDAGLKFFARPGPVTHGEIKNGGLPQWLVEKPGGIAVQEASGQPCWCPWLPSFFLPLYQEKVRQWYDAVMPVLEKYQAQHGGPVIQVQLDNEIHMINWLGKIADYRLETTQRYQEFLRGKYGQIEKLNTAYQTAYRSFQEVRQPEGLAQKESWPWLWDWALYYRDHYAGYYAFLAQQARAKGLRTVLSANVAQFVDFNMYGRGWESVANTNVFRDFSVKIPQSVFGGAFQMRHLDFENYHDIPLTIAALRSITDPGAPVNCAELQVGVLNDRPRIYCSDVELNLKTTAAHGLNGINGYLTFSGQTPDPIQMRGNYHEWQAPVDSQGAFREHAEPLCRFGQFIQKFGQQFSQTEACLDLTLAYDPHYYFTEFIKNDFYSRLQRERNMHFFDGSARVMTLLGYNPELLDLERATPEDLKARPALWLFSMDFMDRAIMRKLVDYVQQGGKLILNPAVPTKDAAMQPCDDLVKALGISVERVVPMAANNMYRQGDCQYMVESDMTILKETGDADVWLRDGEGRACVVHRQVGRGAVLVIGFGLYHQYDYIVELISHLTQKFGLRPRVQKEAWDVHAALRTQGESGWLYVANFHDMPRPLALKYTLPNRRTPRRFPARGKMILPNRSAFFFPVNLALGPDLRIMESTCEVLSTTPRPKQKSMELLIRGVAGQSGIMLFKTPKPIRQARLDGQPVSLSVRGSMTQVQFIPGGQVQKLLIR